MTDVFTGRPMRTYFKDKQVHISAAVVYGILRYVEWTGDDSLLDTEGVRTIVECAKFYYSLLLRRLTREDYEIHDVIGPDEYHERINNNGYTNRMAKYVLENAVKVIETAMQRGTLPEEYDGQELKAKFADAAEKLFLQRPHTGEKHENIIEQFDGYFQMEDVSLEDVRGRLLNEKEYWGGANGVASHTQIIKQADVVTMLNLFSREYDTSVLRANWEYYEPRTEHGSSLSAGMYAMLACKIGEPQRACLSLFYEIGNGRFERGRQRVGRSCLYWWDTSGSSRCGIYDGGGRICRNLHRERTAGVPSASATEYGRIGILCNISEQRI